MKNMPRLQSIPPGVRQRLLVLGGAVALLLVAAQVVVSVWTLVDEKEARARGREREYREVTELAAQLSAIRRNSASRGGPQSGPTIPSLLPWLEKEAGEAGLSGNIRQIAPIALQAADSGLFREKATLGLRELSMETVAGFLARLESVPAIRIVRGDLKRPGEKGQGVLLTLEIGLL